MKIYVRHFSLIFIFLSLCASAQTEKPISVDSITADKQRPKIGLVLSGGGARGFAHIGTLKMIDSLGIPIDYISGTSMGGIIGALYSVGYSGREIEKLALDTDWSDFFSDQPPRSELPYLEKIETGRYQLSIGFEGPQPVLPSGLTNGQKVFQILSRLTYSYQNITDFNKLPIPFSCVAVDIISGTEVVLENGSLALALRSTMSIPTAFSPVEWGDSLLIDGAVLNNLPVDVVRKKGADIVIAVNVGTPKKEREELNSILSILEQTVNLASYKEEERSVRESDIVITPDLEGFSSAGFDRDRIIQIIHRGDAAASRRIYDCLRLVDDLGIPKSPKDYSSIFAENSRPQLHGITITGNTTLPFQMIYDMIDLYPGCYCSEDTLMMSIDRMKDSGLFKEIKLEIRQVDNGRIRLYIKVKEKAKPVIFGVKIRGNEELSFNFIYDILGIKAGTVFNPDEVDRHITELYSLGYFQNIYYEIEPIDEGRIRLIFTVKERPKRELRIGFRFDDNYKLVAAIGFKATNLLINGLRIEDELQFLGLIRFHVKIFYPSRTLDFPVYPFVRAAYKDVSINIYDGSGKAIAKYPDRSWLFAGGLGFLVGNFLNMEIEYNHEQMDVVPEVAFPDPELFPAWKDKLVKIQGQLTVDLIDDPVWPDNGLFIQADAEKAHRDLGSELEYTRFSVFGDYYYTFLERNTVRFYGYYGKGDKKMPVYKYFYKGGPFDFIGADYQQMPGYELYMARGDYRLRFGNNFYTSFIGAVGENIIVDEYDPNTGSSEIVWSYGLSLAYNTPAGPIAFTYGYGVNGTYRLPGNRHYFFFTGGFNF